RVCLSPRRAQLHPLTEELLYEILRPRLLERARLMLTEMQQFCDELERRTPRYMAKSVDRPATARDLASIVHTMRSSLHWMASDAGDIFDDAEFHGIAEGACQWLDQNKDSQLYKRFLSDANVEGQFGIQAHEFGEL